MGNGNRISGGDFQSVTPLECDVGLGLNTQSSSASSSSYYPYKKMNFMSSNSEIYGNTNQIASGFCSKSTTGVSGKVLFTANQWQELERQTIIFKYIISSIPVPPQLLLPLSTQSNKVGSGLRFSNGSDPEPWRCRRTDGKKWRCAKDVAPDQKYCEKHAHKTRSRSRKPVEIKDNNNNNPTIISPANQQNRCNEWFMKNDGVVTPVSQLNNQFRFQQSVQSPNAGSKRDYNASVSVDAAASARRKDFIDAWSRIGGGGDDCSLTLSMQSGGTGVEFDHESFEMAVGMLNGDRGMCGDGYKPSHQWLNQGSWTSGSTPGGPLGEALCLGITSNENMDRHESSDRGYNH